MNHLAQPSLRPRYLRPICVFQTTKTSLKVLISAFGMNPPCGAAPEHETSLHAVFTAVSSRDGWRLTETVGTHEFEGIDAGVQLERSQRRLGELRLTLPPSS